jgi:hypothetical protein
MVIVELRGGHLGAVGRAAALALARVLAFATVVAALTPTIALAGVLTLASVLFLGRRLGRRSVLCAKRGPHAGQQIRGLHRRACACEQTGNSRAGDQHLIGLCHVTSSLQYDFT